MHNPGRDARGGPGLREGIRRCRTRPGGHPLLGSSPAAVGRSPTRWTETFSAERVEAIRTNQATSRGRVHAVVV